MQTLHSGAELFIYMNLCSDDVGDLWRQILKDSSPKNILYALQSLIRCSSNFHKQIGEKIWTFVIKKLDLSTHENLKYLTNEEVSLISGSIAKITSGLISKVFKVYNPSDYILDIKKVEKVTNHPVHIVDENQDLNPTALFPFCEFGGNMAVMGVKIDQFDVPVCNSFRPKIYKDQLCYSVDPNVFKNDTDFKKKFSLTLAIDYNEDRQFDFSLQQKDIAKETDDDSFEESNPHRLVDFITLETIGKY